MEALLIFMRNISIIKELLFEKEKHCQIKLLSKQKTKINKRKKEVRKSY